MPRWTVDTPTTLDFDQVTALRVRAVSGSVAVLSTDERACLDIDRISGQPLLVSHEDGVLTVSYEDLTWDGLLGWLRPQRHSAAITVTVPADCPVQLGVVNAGAIVSGIAAKTSVRSVSGNVTLDGVTGTVEANTVSGDIEAQGIGGQIGFNSVSGDLTLADGSVGRLDAKTVSGRVTADIDLEPDARLQGEFGGLSPSRPPGTNTLNGQLGTGDGLGKLSVTTMSGQVTLLQRDEPGRVRQAASTPGGSR